jgi:hypothetical protein
VRGDDGRHRPLSAGPPTETAPSADGRRGVRRVEQRTRTTEYLELGEELICSEPTMTVTVTVSGVLLVGGDNHGAAGP